MICFKVDKRLSKTKKGIMKYKFRLIGLIGLFFIISILVASLSAYADDSDTSSSFNYNDIDMEQVESSAICEVGYSEQYKVLLIRFKDSRELYRYRYIGKG